MRGGWEGNEKLQAAVRAVDPGVGLIAEITNVVDEDVRVTKSQWDASSKTGSVEVPASGGARVAATTSTLVTHGPDDGTDTTNLQRDTPFGALVVEWLDGAVDRELHRLIARVHPRLNGANPKTVFEFRAQLFRITEFFDDDNFTVEPISREVAVEPVGDVAQDVTLLFQGSNGRYPRVGAPPKNGTVPMTMIRLIAVQSDGSPADNVSWLSDSAQGATKTDSTTYSVSHYDILPGKAALGAQSGTLFSFSGLVTNMPDFTLDRSSFADAAVEFTGVNDFDALTGSGDIVVRAVGHTPPGTSLTFEIDDGGGYVECFDGDVLGEDNTPQGGADLSGVSTTGPWDMNVDLTVDSNGFRTPHATELGLERVAAKSLAKVAEVRGGHRRVNVVTLKGNITDAELHLLKTGEPDYRDYGSNILATNDLVDLVVRVYIGDLTGERLDRREWLHHSTYEVEDYVSLSDRHVLECYSPLRRLRVRIPTFVVTSGNDGRRDPVEVTGTLKACYEEIMTNFGSVPGRLVGPGVESTTYSALKVISDSDMKDELDAVAYLAGMAVRESQGRIKAVDIMRDEPGDVPVAFFPLGSYEAVPHTFGPGYADRIDEFFVKHTWDVQKQQFGAEVRHFNSLALAALGGVGLNTTETLSEEASKWISGATLGNAIGSRIVKHFGAGIMQPRIRPVYRQPHLEEGDVVALEMDTLVIRSPIDGREIRGRVAALATVMEITDHWGTELGLWIKSLDAILPSEGTVARTGLDLLSRFRVTYVPVSTGTSRGWYLDLEYDLGDDVDEVNIDMAQLVPSDSWDYDETLSGSGVHRIQADPSGDYILLNQTTVSVTATPKNTDSSLTGPGWQRTFYGGAEIGAGVKIDDGSSGFYAGDILVPGTDISFGQDANNRPQITNSNPSDRRLKEALEQIPDALERALLIAGYTGRYNELARTLYSGFGDELMPMVVADEVAAALPEAVRLARFDCGPDGLSRSGEDYQEVLYQRLIPLLFQALAELAAEVRAKPGATG